MTDMPIPTQDGSGSLLTQDARTKKRNAAEARFRLYGAIAVGLAVRIAIAVPVACDNGDDVSDCGHVSLSNEPENFLVVFRKSARDFFKFCSGKALLRR